MTGPAVTTVAVVGTGAIGVSWAAHFLNHGLDVARVASAGGSGAGISRVLFL